MPPSTRFGLLLALALVALLPLEARGQEAAPVRRLACGGYDVVPSGFRSPGEATRLSIQKAGRLLASVTDWRIVSTECDDITADGIEELVVRADSGGSHCCETIRVYALDETPRLLLLYEANNAGGLEVRDLDGDGRRELILGDDSFAYFDDLCFTCSPAYLPLVACYTGTRFEDCTRRFPELLKTRRNAFLARLQAATGNEALADAKGAALGVLATSMLLGEEDKGMEAVRAAAPGEAVTAWVSKVLPRVRDWAANRGKKLKDGSERRR